MTPTVVVSARGEQRLESGHPWIYRSDIVDARAAAGDRVQVRGPRGRKLGDALYSDRSQIAIRMLTRGDAPADEELLRRRIAAAIGFRRSLAIDASAYRLVHGDVAVWGGPARFAFHGIAPLADGHHPMLGRKRINVTFRKVL